jgi:hypothetical protein
MSREHHAGCISSRIMSPWLSSAFGNRHRSHGLGFATEGNEGNEEQLRGVGMGLRFLRCLLWASGARGTFRHTVEAWRPQSMRQPNQTLEPTETSSCRSSIFKCASRVSPCLRGSVQRSAQGFLRHRVAS